MSVLSLVVMIWSLLFQSIIPEKHNCLNLFVQSEPKIPEAFLHSRRVNVTQKMKFSIKDYFSKCDQIPRKLRIWSHLLKKSLMENFIFCAVKGVLIWEKNILVKWGPWFSEISTEKSVLLKSQSLFIRK